MKEKFLQNFFFKQNWGLRGSKQRVLAFDSLVRYLQETRSLVETHPSLSHEVNRDHCRLIILKQLPLPADQLDDYKLHDVAYGGDDKITDAEIVKKLEAELAFQICRNAQSEQPR